jgi:hypothetical protein
MVKPVIKRTGPSQNDTCVGDNPIDILPMVNTEIIKQLVQP